MNFVHKKANFFEQTDDLIDLSSRSSKLEQILKFKTK